MKSTSLKHTRQINQTPQNEHIMSSELAEKKGVWFVYDGDCPICTQASKALKIKARYGELHTLDARRSVTDPLLNAINQLGYDLDEGMVIYRNGEFYHGKDALKFMAQFGRSSSFMTGSFKILFWSDAIARLLYPWMRGTRNALLHHKRIGKIDNLQQKKEPIFKPIFGDYWDELPPVFKKHYANRPYTTEKYSVEGTLTIECKPPLMWLAPVMRLLGQIPTCNETNVPVTVNFESDPNSRAFRFNRTFYLVDKKPYVFRSTMVPIKDNQIIELMRFGLGWKLRCEWDGQKIVLSHLGYVLNLFGHYIPLPLTLLMGAGYAEEHAIDDNTFDMFTHITHPLWGKVYEYRGRFKVCT